MLSGFVPARKAMMPSSRMNKFFPNLIRKGPRHPAGVLFGCASAQQTLYTLHCRTTTTLRSSLITFHYTLITFVPSYLLLSPSYLLLFSVFIKKNEDPVFRISILLLSLVLVNQFQ